MTTGDQMLLPAIDKADISPGVQMAATAHNPDDPRRRR
jgi:hypothetical protein